MAKPKVPKEKWKCPKCSYSATGKGAYNKVQKHYGQKHGKTQKRKGTGVYKPPKGFGGK